MIKKILIVIAFIVVSANAIAPCLNPIKNIDWEFFGDNFDFKAKTCACKVPGNDLATQAGFQISFFEPIAVLEETNQPWSFPCFGFSLDHSFWKKQGYSQTEQSHLAFKHSHFIIYPIMSLLNLVQSYVCFERAGILNFAFLSEIMPQYNNDIYATFLNPDKLLLDNPVASLSCLTDCMSSSFYKPINSMYWCTGCWEATYTDTGFNNGKQPILASATLAVRVLDSMHHYYALTKTSNASFSANVPNGVLQNTMCHESFFPKVIKTQYALQLAGLPKTWSAVKLGQYRAWANFKNTVNSKDDVAFFVWRKRDECAGAYKCRSTFTGQ